nr:hypothetical protein [Luteibacter rhizovicinus]
MSTSHSHSSRRVSRFFLALVALTGIAFGAALPLTVHASSAVCALGSHDVTWSPGVTNTVADHDVTADTTWNCVQALRAPLLTTASSHAEFSAPFSCVNLFSTEPTTWTIAWSDGIAPATSTFTYTATVVPAAGNLVITAPGSITSGRYSGHMAEAEFVLANLAATLGDQCKGLPGVTNANGTSTLVII